MNVGFRVYTQLRRPAREIIAAFGDVSVPNLSDAMHGLYTMDSTIRPLLASPPRFVGPAITVSMSPGDGMMLREAIGLSKPGDVIVVNAFGARDRAVLGGTLMAVAQELGVAGMVIDGAVRDLAEMEQLAFPVMARALTPRSGTTQSGWGEVNLPIACGGVAVHPGDVVVADCEGVVIVPSDEADSVATAAAAVEAEKGHPDADAAAKESRFETIRARARTAMLARDATVVEGVYGRSSSTGRGRGSEEGGNR